MRELIIIGVLALLYSCSTDKKQVENTDYEIGIFQGVNNVVKSKGPKVKYKNHELFVLDSIPEEIEIVEYDLGNDGKKEIIVAYTFDDIEAVVTVFSGDNFNKIAETTNSAAIRLKDGNIIFESYHIDNTEQNIYGIEENKFKWIDEIIIDVN